MSMKTIYFIVSIFLYTLHDALYNLYLTKFHQYAYANYTDLLYAWVICFKNRIVCVMSKSQQYCVYCGRVAHRCLCDKPDSDMQRFLERGGKSYVPRCRDTHYKRGVPPQIKKRERATMQKNYKVWYQELVKSDGEGCGNCGMAENLVVDHILPIAKGGLSEIDNLQFLCAECNRIKGKLMIDCRGV